MFIAWYYNWAIINNIKNNMKTLKIVYALFVISFGFLTYIRMRIFFNDYLYLRTGWDKLEIDGLFYFGLLVQVMSLLFLGYLLWTTYKLLKYKNYEM